MLRSLLPLLLAPALLQAPGISQTTARAATPRDAGVLRMVDGTWTRSPASSGLLHGSIEALYRNDALANYYSVLPDGASITDGGRIPGTGSEGDADVYTVKRIRFGYCTGQANPLGASLEVFESYAPCSAPGASPTATVPVTGLPAGGGPGSLACWIVTLDLEGSTLEFTLGADGGDGFDDDPALDSFGLRLSLTGHGADPLTGPLRAGDPLNAPHGAGTRSAWGFPAGPGTGLGQEDRFWIASGAFTGCVPGSYPVTPWNGLFAVFEGDVPDGNLLTPFPCPVAPNSTGQPALISATGSTSMADGNFVLRAGPVNQFQPGIFYYGPNQIQVPFGNGVRCVGGQVTRLPPVMESGGQLVYEASGQLVLLGAVGSTISVQAWYRDLQAGGFFFNLSDGGFVTIDP